jgi:uncharacterized protein
MEINVIWSHWDKVGLEHLHLIQKEDAILANGLILTLVDSLAYRVAYHIQCDTDWRVRKVKLELLNFENKVLELQADGVRTLANRDRHTYSRFGWLY